MRFIKTIILIAFCLTCFSTPSFSNDKQTIDFDALRGKPIPNEMAELIIEKALNGDKKAQDYISNLDVFKQEKVEEALLNMKKTGKNKYVFEDGSFIETGTSMFNVRRDNNIKGDHNISPAKYGGFYVDEEKYVGVGIGNVNAGAYFIFCSYYVIDQNHIIYETCRDRSQCLPGFAIDPRGCAPNSTGVVYKLSIDGSYTWSTNFGGGATCGARLVYFPEFNSNYITRTY